MSDISKEIDQERTERLQRRIRLACRKEHSTLAELMVASLSLAMDELGIGGHRQAQVVTKIMQMIDDVVEAK